MPRKSTPRDPVYPDDFIGPQEPHVLTLVPFPGFYNTWLSDDIDNHDEQEAEQFAEKERGGYQGIEYPETLQPVHCQITEDEFGELILAHMDYGALHRRLTHCWVDALNLQASECVGFDLGLRFESMDSPAYYNFETDRAFAHIPLRVVRRLMWELLRSMKGRTALRQRIAERHRSRSGFHSFYSTRWGEWAKRIRATLTGADSDLDHNHLQTILEAALIMTFAPGETLQTFKSDVHDLYLGDDGIYQEWDASLRWKDFDRACCELRAEKDQAYREAHADEPIPETPCPDTADLFNPTERRTP